MKKILRGTALLLSVFLLPFATYAAVSISETHTNVNCNGGSTATIDITPSGGTAPYTFNWSDSPTTEDRSGLAAGNYQVTVTDNLGATNSILISISEPSAMTTLTSVTSVYCGGGNTGAIDLTVFGGSPGYTYAWNDFVYTEDRANLTAAVYYVTVTDSKGCSKIDSANVTQPPGMVLSKTITNVTCGSGANGAIDLTVSFGIPGYSYLWNDGILTQDRVGIASGTYTVTVTDMSGCTAFLSAVVGQTGGGMVVNSVSTNPSCYGGSNGTITVTSVIGSVSPYTFHWSDGSGTQNRTGMSAGSYTVTATSTTGCTTAATINVTQPVQLNVTLNPIQLTCFGSNNGAINTNVTGGTSPFSYSWGGGVFTQNRTGLASGNYTVTVTDFKGCTATQTAFVPQPLQLTITTTSSPLACIGGPTGSVTTTVSGGVGSYSYWWGAGVTSPDQTNVNAGNYSVTVTDGNGCTASATSTVLSYTSMVLTSTQVNELCYGASTGSVDLSVANGWSPFTYSWTNSSTTQDVNSLAQGSYTVTVTDNHSCTATKTVAITQPSFPIAINSTVVDVTCNAGNNGAITIGVSNGAFPYTYNWGGVFTQNRTSLIAGNYAVTVTDNNACTVSTSITVNQPTPVVIASTVIDATCFGGSTGAINLNVTGGFAPYTYLWNDGVITQNRTGLAQGTYPVTVTDNHSCSSTASIAVGQPAAIAITPTVVNLTCNNISTGSISLSVIGGVAPYSYNWGGVTTQNRASLAAGSYIVTVTDNAGCTSSNTSTVTQPLAINISTAVTNVSCNGGSNGAISVTTSGGNSPYSYDWGLGITTPNRTGLTQGVYTVTVTDNNGCTIAKTTSVIQPVLLSLSTVATNIACYGASTGNIALTVTGGTSGYTFNWSNGAITQNNNNIPAGNYSVTVTDLNGCSAGTSAVITEGSQITTSTSSVNATCFGTANGSVDLSVNGGTGTYTYVWSNGATTQDISNIVANSYNVTVKDASNCTVLAIASIAQPTQIVLSVAQINSSCYLAANGSIDLTVTGGTPNYSYNWSNGATVQDISNLTPQIYSVTVVDNDLCSATTSINITEPSIITLTEVRQHVSCYGGSNGTINTTPSGGVGPYTFDWGNGVNTQNISGLSAGSYFVTVTDANSCTSSYGFAITQPTALSLSTNKTDVTCNGAATGAIDLTVTGGTVNYLYHWDNSLVTQDIAGVNAGTYSVTVTDANACTAVAAATITQPVAITLSFTLANVTCNGGSNGSINTIATGGNGGYHFNWSNGGTTPGISGLPAGGYLLTLNDATNCATTLSFNIAQPAPINLSQTHTNLTCSGNNNGAIDVSASGGSFPYSYSWSNGAVTQDLTALAPNSYTLTVTDNASCTAVLGPVNITQGASINLGETHQAYACSNKLGAIDLSVTGGTAPYSYSWTGGAATQDLNNLTPGNYSVVVTDAHTCTASASVAIAQIQPLSTSITTTNVTCHGGNNGAIALFVQGGTAPYTYSWNQGANTPNLANLPASNYRVLIIDSNSCNTTDSANISQPASIQIAKTVTDVTCFGLNNGAINITATGGPGGYTYTWNTTASSPNLINLSRGTYSLTVTDAQSCTASTGNILVSEPQQLNLVSTVTSIGCTGHNDGAVQIQVTGGIPPFTYGWSNSGSTATITNLTTGSYDVVVTDSKACTVTGSYTIGASAPMVITPVVLNTACDQVQTGAINLTVTGGTSAYTFNWNNGESTQNLTGLSRGVYAVTVTDARNCSAQGNYSIAADYELTVDANPSTTINLGESVQLTAVTNVDHGNVYAWSPAGEVACGSCASTEATPNFNTFYTINVVDANGCKASDTLSVTVNSITDIFIPNAFTPNNDGNNDVLQLFGDINTVAYLDFAVFNRWGEKVFESSNANFTWNGTYKGEPAPQGVYIYTAKMVFINGYARNNLKGSLTLIR